jgi:hypothetical protein
MDWDDWNDWDDRDLADDRGAVCGQLRRDGRGRFS